MKTVKVTVLMLMAALAMPLFAQDKPADNMSILRDKIQADKKLVVATNLKLTEAEAKKFWPVYESYQTELQGINERLVTLIKDYAENYNNDTVDDTKAKAMIDEALAIEDAETALKKKYVPKLSETIPATKVARYLQMETKIRAIGRYELAANVPLVE